MNFIILILTIVSLCLSFYVIGKLSKINRKLSAIEDSNTSFDDFLDILEKMNQDKTDNVSDTVKTKASNDIVASVSKTPDNQIHQTTKPKIDGPKPSFFSTNDSQSISDKSTSVSELSDQLDITQQLADSMATQDLTKPKGQESYRSEHGGNLTRQDIDTLSKVYHADRSASDMAQQSSSTSESVELPDALIASELADEFISNELQPNETKTIKPKLETLDIVETGSMNSPLI